MPIKVKIWHINRINPSQKSSQKQSISPPPCTGHGGVVSGSISEKDIPERIGLREQTSKNLVYQHLMSRVSELTRKAYASDLAVLAVWLGEDSAESAVNRFLGLSGPEANLLALRWLESMHESNTAASTQARRISALRSAIRIARTIGMVSWDLEVKPPRAQGFRDTRGISPEDVKKLLGLCGEDAIGKRNRALIWVLFTLGLRRSEISKLKIGDYDRKGSRIFIHGKGGERNSSKNQWRTISNETVKVLDDWLDTDDRDTHANLFIGWKNNKKTKGLNTSSIWKIVNRLGKKIDIRVWPHSFRHSGATTALKEGESIANVQKFMRHSDPKTTMIYDDDVTDAPGKVSELLSKVLKE